ncbi:MAG: AMP-binding protein [Lachnospiraceae bacterium]|jgi:long-subunit acyl-CoA synthetase (AMP-forming)|nr:AMP-binding protein [Lachnospiraceae bacterium]
MMITAQNTKTIYDLVQNAGRNHGNHVFLRYEENDVIFDVTYEEFAAQCSAIGAWTAGRNETYGHKVKVGLLGSSSHHYLAVLFGVMGNGNTGIPLDIQMNIETFADCLNRSDVDILFYDWDHHLLVEGVKEKCPHVKEYISLQHGKHVPCSDNILKEYAGQAVTPQVSPEDLAMILFTSGTTGRGKGVMLSNGNLIDNTFCTTDTDHPEREVYLNVLPIHHVFCINGDVLIVMRYGGTLCLNRDMAKLAAHIQLFQPSVIRMVPMIAKTLYNRIAIMSRQTGQPVGKVRSQVLGKQLHKIISGGGYLAPDLAENYRNLGISIAQGYGMSECSPKISSPDWSRPDKVASVGRIVDRCQVRIVDGEIQVKSPSVMMGYYKEPDKTAEVMTEDGWLCTGDLGYVDEEGFLYLTGRKKNLIILSNGENVAPEQIENLFEDDRVIEDILVFGEDDMVTAEVYPNFKYIEAAGITDIHSVVSEIIKKHNEDLPTFKRIMNFRIREIPFAKTSSKKIIRSQYFTQKKKEKEELENVRKPENELQTQIYECISAVLGHQRFGIDTDLYTVGLDSLGSVMLLSDLYGQAGVSMTLKDLTDHRTVLELEAFIMEERNREPVDFAVRDVYPLTNLQLYFAYVMRGNTTANLPFLFKLDKSVDLDRLKKAVEDVFDIHPGLKGVVQLHEGAFHNLRHDERRVEIPIADMSEEQWKEHKKELLKPYMYMENEPLYHVGIYRTEAFRYLYFDIAHIMGDGITMNVLLEDINALYAGQPVEKESYTFFEYILDEKDRDARGLRTENEAYFQKLMEGFRIRKSILNLKDSYDLANGENAVLKGRFGSLNRKKLTGFGRKYSVSENAIFLTAYNYCIGIFSNEKDTVSTSIHSGRTDSRWARLAGPLFLTYYFRYTNVAHETVPQLLQKSGQQIIDTMGCYISNLHADEMFFQYQGDILNIDQIGGAPAQRMKIQLDSLPFHMQVMSDENGYFYELRYWKNRFDRMQLKIFLVCLETIVEAMQEETSVRRLRKHLPETVFPKHYRIAAGALNREAGSELLESVSRDTRVKVYVFNDECRKQPFGAWGNLYVMDHPTVEWVDKITNPYGPGELYQTGRIARILPDGSIDFLENGGRTIMQEGIMGRNFLDLEKLERILRGYEGVKLAQAYIRYGEGNKLILQADVTWEGKEPDKGEMMAYLEKRCEKALIPGDIRMEEA